MLRHRGLSLIVGLALLAGSPEPARARGGVAVDRVFVHRIDDHAQFVQFSVPLNGTPFTKFVIDARSGQPYYFWTAVYPFHYHFVNEVLLKGRPGAYANIHDFNRRNHEGNKRDFLLGSIAFHPSQRIYTFEFLEVDQPSADIIRRTHEILSKSFFDTGLLWRPLGKAQNAIRAKLPAIPIIEPGTLAAKGNYQFLNAGRSVGRLHVVRPGTDASIIDFDQDEIVVLHQTPIDIAPVAGVISIRFSTPLSHVNLRARAWGIPNCALTDALVRTRGLEGKWVYFEARPGQESYTGSERNGVNSADWSSWPRSFEFVDRP